MSIKFYTPDGRVHHYVKVFRTLNNRGAGERHATLEEAKTAAQIEADRTHARVGIEEWALNGVHDHLNAGWGLIDVANPTSGGRKHASEHQ
jgi:hypothetical protein